MKLIEYPQKADLKDLLKRPEQDNTSLEANVYSILSEVKRNGDAALKEFSLKFDGLAVNELRVSEEEITRAEKECSVQLKGAIMHAKDNIETFHRSQMISEERIRIEPGLECWQR